LVSHCARAHFALSSFGLVHRLLHHAPPALLRCILPRAVDVHCAVHVPCLRTLTLVRGVLTATSHTCGTGSARFTELHSCTRFAVLCVRLVHGHVYAPCIFSTYLRSGLLFYPSFTHVVQDTPLPYYRVALYAFAVYISRLWTFAGLRDHSFLPSRFYTFPVQRARLHCYVRATVLAMHTYRFRTHVPFGRTHHLAFAYNVPPLDVPGLRILHTFVSFLRFAHTTAVFVPRFRHTTSHAVALFAFHRLRSTRFTVCSSLPRLKLFVLAFLRTTHIGPGWFGTHSTFPPAHTRAATIAWFSRTTVCLPQFWCYALGLRFSFTSSFCFAHVCVTTHHRLLHLALHHHHLPFSTFH